MSDYYKRDPLDELATAIGMAAIIAPILAAIAVAQHTKKKNTYKLEAQYESLAPGIVIGDCEYVTFAEGRPQQVGVNSTLLPPPKQKLPKVEEK